MPLLPPVHPSLCLTPLRTFSTTCRTLAKSTKQRLKHEHSAVPEYPYGPSQIYKQSNFGLYGTQKIRFGNMVSEKNEIKTRRWWRPNVHAKKLWSDALGKMVRVRITMRVLRTLDKVGGLDEYLLGEKRARIRELGMGGWKLRWRIMQTDAVKERFRAERVRMGLLPKKEEGVNSRGNKATREQVDEEVRLFDEEIEKGVEIEVGEDGREELDAGFVGDEPARTPSKIQL